MPALAIGQGVRPAESRPPLTELRCPPIPSDGTPLARTRPVSVALGSRTQEIPQRPLGRDLFWWFARAGLISRPADSFLARRMRARGELIVGTRTADLRRAGVEFLPRATSAAGSCVAFADGSSRTVAAVVWATGYRSDYSWVDVPGIVVDGQPVHRGGVTDVPGLYFLGQPWQRARGSSLLGFVQHDAAHLTGLMRGHVLASRSTVGP